MNDVRHVQSKYFLWLNDLIEANSKAKSYFRLLKDMYATPFHWVLALDANRSDDGLALREDYDAQCLSNLDRGAAMLLDDNCSVLEVLVGMAIRMDYELSSISGSNYVSKYFWELVENLGLLDYDDSSYSIETSDEVLAILIKWMDRDYPENGIGSPFPLHSKDCDQKYLEMWYQMQAYIDENYEY